MSEKSIISKNLSEDWNFELLGLWNRFSELNFERVEWWESCNYTDWYIFCEIYLVYTHYHDRMDYHQKLYQLIQKYWKMCTDRFEFSLLHQKSDYYMILVVIWLNGGKSKKSFGHYGIKWFLCMWNVISACAKSPYVTSVNLWGFSKDL